MNERVPLSDVLLDQRRGWETGERPALEALLRQHPHLAGQPDAVLDLVYQEVVLREEAGEKPRLADYEGRFPHLADALRVQFEVDDALVPPAGGSTVPAPGPSTALSDLPPLDGVEVLDELGRGSMGVVYRGWQKAAKRPVAVKVLSGEMPEGRARTEVEAASRLQHPHIVTVYEVKELAGRTALVLEYVEGGTLAQKLQGKPQPPRDAARFIQTLAWAMAYAHSRGVVHRDLKPGNILLSAGPDAPLAKCQPRISDFGLAKLLEASAHLTKTNDILGTPSYMAPEQAASAGDAGPAADVYALGAILYETLTGRPPFVGQSLLDTLDQVRSREPVPPARLEPAVPKALERICLKCLEKKPAHRYASARELAEDLGHFLKDEPVRAQSIGWGLRFRAWLRKPGNTARAMALGVAAMALVAVLLWMVRKALLASADSAGAAHRLRAQEEENEALRLSSLLLRAGAMARDDPDGGLRLLESVPADRRCFSWGVLHAMCKPWESSEARHAGPVRAFAASPDGKLVATTDGQRVSVGEGSWDAPGATALSAAAGVVAVGFADGRVEIRAAGGEKRLSFRAGPGRVAGLALASQGRWLLANAGAGAALWDARTGKKRLTLDGIAGQVVSLAWSRNGRETPAERRYNPAIAKTDLFRLGYIAAYSQHSTGAALDLTLVDLKADNS
ncbi:MAG: protein kinase, partial [Gemmataceae bacterium]|nr:protein kinase [Gemmataceae bacterium]